LCVKPLILGTGDRLVCKLESWATQIHAIISQFKVKAFLNCQVGKSIRIITPMPLANTVW
jgi:hypothetical protein